MKTSVGIGYSIALFSLLYADVRHVRAEELVPVQGEIRLDGTVRSVDVAASKLILDATSFTLPTGKSSSLAPAKAKTVDIAKTTLIHVRGNINRKVSLTDLKGGVFLIAIGSDAGGGKNLPAREIAVWDRVANGQYEFAAPKVKPPVAAPPTTTPPVTTPPVTTPPSTVPPFGAPPVLTAPKPAPDAPPVTPPPFAAPPVLTAPKPQPAPVAVPPDVVLANGGVATPATTVGNGPLLTVRIKTGSPSAAADLALAPGTALPPALAKLAKAPRIFLVSFETAQQAPDNATATLTMPAGLKRPSPSELRIIQPREPVRGMMRPFTANIFWGNSKTVPAGEPKESELDALIYGYYTHQRKPPERYSGAASVAIGPRVAPDAGGAPPAGPPEGATAVGDYTLQTSYAGQTRFKISEDQDFLEPIKLDAPKDKVDFSQPVTLQWQTVPRAIGYRFKVIGMRSKGAGLGNQVIIWTSSAVAPEDALDDQNFDDPARAVREGLLLPATAKSCTVPAGVLNGMATVTLIAEAFGPGQTIKGNPSVRIVVQSENLLSLTSADAEAINAAVEAGRPRPRPRPQEIPTSFTGEPKAWVRISTHVNETASVNKPAPPTDIDTRSAPYRYFSVNLAAKDRAQEEMTASLSVPAGLYITAPGAEAKPLALRIQPPSRSQISTTARDAQIFWGNGEAVANGQPVALSLSYDDQSAIGMASTRASYSGAGSIAAGPYGEPNAMMRPASKSVAAGHYSLQTSYAGKAEFTVGAENDYLQPVRAWFASEASDFTKPITINWRPVARALGYRISIAATRADLGKPASTVIWTATRNQPADVRLVTSHLEDVAAAVTSGDVLPPDATSFTLPAGIFTGTRDVQVRIEAIGPTLVVPSTPTSPAVQVSTNSVATIGLVPPRTP